jgi:hypothetical protein
MVEPIPQQTEPLELTVELPLFEEFPSPFCNVSSSNPAHPRIETTQESSHNPAHSPRVGTAQESSHNPAHHPQVRIAQESSHYPAYRPRVGVTQESSHNPDVIHELFGNTHFTVLAVALEREIDDLLWQLQHPLGIAAFLNIRRHPVPATQLIYSINDRRADRSLTDPFRDYVLSSVGLYYLLTPDAKEEADRRRSSEAQITEGRHTSPDDQRATLQSSFYNQPFNLRLEESGADKIAASIIASDKDIYTPLIQKMAKQWVDVELRSEFTVQNLGRVQSVILTTLSEVLSAEMDNIESAVGTRGIQLQRYARMVELRDRADKEIERERNKRFSIAFCGLAKAGCV